MTNSSGSKLMKLSRRQAYNRIRSWLMAHAAGDLVSALPPSKTVSDADMDFVFGEVIFGRFEEFYIEKDEAGIKLSEYANHGVSKKYGKGIHEDAFTASRHRSKFSSSPPASS